MNTAKEIMTAFFDTLEARLKDPDCADRIRAESGVWQFFIISTG